MKDMMDKAKEKMVQKIVRKKVEKALGKESDGEEAEGEGGGEEEYETDNNTEATGSTSKASSGFGSKLANKFRKLRRSKNSKSSDNENNSNKESNTETPIQTSDGSEQNEDSDHFSVPTSQDNSDWESDGSNDTENIRGKDLAFDKEMIKPMNDDNLPQDKKTKFTIAIRIIDAIELQGFEGQELNPMVRTVVGKKCRKTHVIRGTDNPYWDQSLYFTMNTTLVDLSSKTAEFRVYSAGSFLRNSLIGGFRYDLGLIYKSPNHKSLGKWLALRSVSDDSENEDGQIRGFLRICAGITYPGYSGSASLPFNPNDCEVVDAADALCYRLQFRAFKLLSIVYDIRFGNKKAPKAPVLKAPKAPVLLGIEIMLGQHRVESTFQEASDENTAINEELLLPIMWPSVSR
uniref:C2 domain-containing protein n=1 Tax=Panagrolaimus sp. ES5 TaxID=591445 RepID=A0AC34FWN6_9BILA